MIRASVSLRGLGVVFVFTGAMSAKAATFNIADGDVASLSAAIQTANINGDSSTINLAPKGNYILTAVSEIPPEYNSPGPVGLPVIRSQVTINGNGATIRRSTAPGTPDFVPLAVSGRTESCGNATCLTSPSLTLNQTTLTGGSAGGLHLNAATAIVQGSTVTQNTGGGINNACSQLTLLNSTVSYNSSDSAWGGGGVFLWQFSCAPGTPTANISFSTIFENSNPGWGRGNSISMGNGGFPGSILVKNSILASPSHPSEPVCNSGNGNNQVVSLGHNILGNALDVFGSLCAIAFTEPGDLILADPLLGPLVDNGGPTLTDLPLTGSPAIDAVPLSYCTDALGNTVATDQRGFPRPQGIACDVGSVDVASDTTPPLISPVISGLSGSGGWYRGPVSVSWNVADPESGISSNSGCGPVMLTANTTGTTLTCSATNGVGLSSSASTTIKIDQAPPAISGMPAPGCTIWPPNKKMVQVGIVTASDALSGVAGGSLHVTGTSNEPSDPNNPDIVITPSGTGGFVIQLRADRLGNGTGRVYTVTTTASDVAGNPVTSVASCTVPHDQGN